MRHLVRAGVVAVSLAAATGLTGCGQHSNSPGAAAMVGDQRISTQTLQAVVDRSLQDPQAAQNPQIGGDRAAWTRNELGRLINNDLIAAAAAARGVTATPNDIDQQLNQLAQQYGGVDKLDQQAAQNGVPKQDLSEFIKFFVLQQKLADALVAKVPVSTSDLQAAYQKNLAQFQSIHTAHILVKSKSLAEQLLRRVKANPSSFSALAAKYSQDPGSKDKGGDIGFAPRGQLDPGYANAAFAAAPGSYVVAQSQFGWHVIHVLAKRTVPLAKAETTLKSDLLKQQRQSLLDKELGTEASKLGVHVNPRYGKWDPTKRQVVPIDPGSDLSSPAPGASASG